MEDLLKKKPSWDEPYPSAPEGYSDPRVNHYPSALGSTNPYPSALGPRTEPYQKASTTDRVKDALLDLGTGLVSLEEARIGVQDVFSGGKYGKVMEDYGWDTRAMKNWLLKKQSEERQYEQEQVSQAYDESFVGGIGASFDNPATLVGSVIQSAPLLAAIVGASAVTGGGLPVAAGAEGLLQTGMMAEGLRQENEGGLLKEGDVGYSAASGAMTGALGFMGGRLAQKLGVIDPDVMFQKSIKNIDIAKAIGGGALTEGVFEELPQSAQEQVMMNLAQDKPWDEGLSEAAGTGMLSGAAMGGGINALAYSRLKIEKAKQDIEDVLAAEALQIETEELQQSRAVNETAKENVKRGVGSRSLIGDASTLDEQKVEQSQADIAANAEQQREEVEANAEFAATEIAEIESVVADIAQDPLVQAISQEIGVDSDDFNRTTQVEFFNAGNVSEFTRNLVKKFGTGVRKFTHQLWKRYKASPLGEDRGSIVLKNLREVYDTDDALVGRYGFTGRGLKDGFKTAAGNEVKGRTFKVEGLDDFEFFVYPEAGEDGMKFSVAEKNSGKRIARGTNQTDAAEEAVFTMFAEKTPEEARAVLAAHTGAAPTVNEPNLDEMSVQERVAYKIQQANKGQSNEKHTPKEVNKVLKGRATQFIGEGKQGSSTDKYMKIWAEEGLANTGKYTADDVVMIAANGRRGGGIMPITEGNRPVGAYKNLAKAIAAGATIVADTRDHLMRKGRDGKPYNTGEIRITKYLNSKGYERVSDVDGVGTWKPKVEGANLAKVVITKGLVGKSGSPVTPQGINTLRMRGTDKHFGNPFSSEVKGLIPVESTAEAVARYKSWVKGETDEKVEPERRAWIVKQIKEGRLDGKNLLYYKDLGEPSHADGLAELVNDKSWIPDYVAPTVEKTSPLKSKEEVGEIVGAIEPTPSEELELVEDEDDDAAYAIEQDKTTEELLDEDELTPEQLEEYERNAAVAAKEERKEEASGLLNKKIYKTKALRQAFYDIYGSFGKATPEGLEKLRQLYKNVPQKSKGIAAQESNQAFLDAIAVLGHHYKLALDGLEEITDEEQAYLDSQPEPSAIDKKLSDPFGNPDMLAAAQERMADWVIKQDMALKGKYASRFSGLDEKIKILKAAMEKEVEKTKNKKGLSEKDREQNIRLIKAAYNQKIEQYRNAKEVAGTLRHLNRKKAKPVGTPTKLASMQVLWENQYWLDEVLAPLDERLAEKRRNDVFDAILAQDLSSERFTVKLSDVPAGMFSMNSFDTDEFDEDNQIPKTWSTPKESNIFGEYEGEIDLDRIARSRETRRFRSLFPISKYYRSRMNRAELTPDDTGYEEELEKVIAAHIDATYNQLQKMYKALKSNKRLAEEKFMPNEKYEGLLKSRADFIISDIQELSMHYTPKSIEAMILQAENIGSLASLQDIPDILLEAMEKHNNGTLSQIFEPLPEGYQEQPEGEAVDSDTFTAPQAFRKTIVGPPRTTRKQLIWDKTKDMTFEHADKFISHLNQQMGIIKAANHITMKDVYKKFMEAVNDANISSGDYLAFYQTISAMTGVGLMTDIVPLDAKIIAERMAGENGLGSKQFKGMKKAEQEKVVEKILATTNINAPFEHSVFRSIVEGNDSPENSKLVGEVRGRLNATKSLTGESRVSNDAFWDELQGIFARTQTAEDGRAHTFKYSRFYAAMVDAYGKDVAPYVTDLYDELLAYNNGRSLYSIQGEVAELRAEGAYHDIPPYPKVGSKEMREMRFSLINTAMSPVHMVEYIQDGTVRIGYVAEHNLKSFPREIVKTVPMGLTEYAVKWQRRTDMVRTYELVRDAGLLEDVAQGRVETELANMDEAKRNGFENLEQEIIDRREKELKEMERLYNQLKTARGEIGGSEAQFNKRMARLRATLANKYHTEILEDKDFFKDLAKKHKMQEEKLFQVFWESGGKKSTVYQYIIGQQANRVADAVYTGKIEALNDALTPEQRKLLAKYQRKENLSVDERNEVNYLAELFQKTKQPFEKPAKEGIGVSMGRSLATVKHGYAKEVHPNDIFVPHEPTDAFGIEFLAKANDTNTRIGSLRDRISMEFYKKVSEAWDADLVIISSGKVSSHYIPVASDGRSKLIININSSVPVHRLYAHELLHHVLNNVTEAEYKAFKAGIVKAVGTQQFTKIAYTIYQNKKSPIFDMDDAQEEALAEVFSTIFWRPQFYEELSKKGIARNSGAKAIVKMFERYSQHLSLYNMDGFGTNYEKMLYMNDDHMRRVGALFADVVGAKKTAEQLRSVKIKHSNEAIINELRNLSKKGFNKAEDFWEYLFPAGVEREDLRDYIEAIFSKMPDFLEKLRPSFMYLYWNTDQHARDISYKYIHGVSLELYRARERVIGDRIDMFKGHTTEELMLLHDFFGRYMEVYTEEVYDAKLNETFQVVKKRKVKGQKFTKPKNNQYGGKMTVAFKNRAKEYGQKLADDGFAVDPNFINDEVIKFFEDLKTASDEIHKRLTEAGYDIPYVENHFGQTVLWYKGGWDTSDPSWVVGKSKRFVFRERELSGNEAFTEERMQDMTSQEIAAEQGLSARTFDPVRMLYDYVRDAAKVYLFYELMNEASIQRDTDGKLMGFVYDNPEVAANEGYLPINDKMASIIKNFDPEDPDSPKQQVGFKVKFDEGGDTYATTPIFRTKKAAEAYVNHLNENVDIEREYYVEPYNVTVKEAEAARMYFHPDIAKLLNNILTTDLIRSKRWGEKLMQVKNHYTSWEFAFSLFHGMTITQEAFAHAASREQQLKQMGFGRDTSAYTKPHKFLKESLNDMLNLKVLADKVYANPEMAEWQSVRDEVERMVGIPNFDILQGVEDYFLGGGLDRMDSALRASAHYLGRPRYRTEPREVHITPEAVAYSVGDTSAMEWWASMMETYENLKREYPNEPMKAFANWMRFASMEGTSAWLMEIAIPSIKMAAALQQIAINLELYKYEIEAGLKTRAEVVQDTVRFVEDKFGEVNWLNQHHDPTAQTSLMFMWRSYTWFTGSVTAGAKASSDIIKTGWFKYARGDKEAQLTEKGLWAFNAVYAHVATALLIMAFMKMMWVLFSGGEEAETPDDVPWMTRLLFPRSDKLDPNKRVAIPSYVTEFYKIARHTGVIGNEAEYSKMVSGRFNSMLSKSLQLFNNADWRGTTIMSHNDNIAEQAWDAIYHMLPAPISLSTASRSIREKGFDLSDVALGLGGFVSAPAAALRSDAANKAYEIRRKEYKGRETTEEEMEGRFEVRRAVYQYSQGKKKPLNDMVFKGKISKKQKENALSRVPYIEGKKNPNYLPPLAHALKGLTLKGAIEVWDYMTPLEKETYRETIKTKYGNVERRSDRPRQYKKEMKSKLEELGILD